MIFFLNPKSSAHSIVDCLSKSALSIVGLCMVVVFMASAQVPVPSSPLLTYPSNNQTDVILGSLNWSETAWATWYNLQVSTDSSFNANHVDTTLTSVSINMMDIYLQYGVKYYWRVNAKNSIGVSPWSAVWRFTTRFFTPNLIFPLNYQTDVSLNPELKWDSVYNGKSYHVQVSTDSNFKSTSINDSLVTTASKVIGPLLPNTIYYWRVKYKNNSGVSGWSERRAFATAPSTATISQSFSATCYSLFYSGHIIKYALPATVNVSLKILDLQGKVVWHLSSTAQNAGYYCQNISNNNLRPGQYFLEFKAGSYSVIKKISMVD